MKQVGAVPEGEESTTVGTDVTTLSNTPVLATPTEEKEVESESRKLVAIPEDEEALEVGAEIGELCLAQLIGQNVPLILSPYTMTCRKAGSKIGRHSRGRSKCGHTHSRSPW